MMDLLYQWRAEALTIIALLISAFLLGHQFKQPFWRMWIHGSIMGLAIEIMTEPLWTYTLKLYLWRDVSPFIAAGWGIMFAWLIYWSDRAYTKIVHQPINPGLPGSYKILLFDLIIGVPLFLTNELSGLHVLRVWRYNEMLGWNTMIPVIQYPVEGIISLVVFILGLSSAVRYWKG